MFHTPPVPLLLGRDIRVRLIQFLLWQIPFGSEPSDDGPPLDLLLQLLGQGLVNGVRVDVVTWSVDFFTLFLFLTSQYP